MHARFAVAALLVALAASRAFAQDASPAVIEGGSYSVRSSDARSKAHDWMIMPAGAATLGGTLSFVTSDAGVGADGIGEGDLAFTDVVMLSLSGRYSIAGKAEVFLDTTLLPKQPEAADELAWQSAALGGRVGFGKRYAGFVRAAGGAMLGDAGYWGGADAGVEARKSIDPTIVFQGSLAGAATSLFFDPRPDEAFWLAEVVVDGEIVFRTPRGEAAAWIGTQFRFPVASNPDAGFDPTAAFLDPRTRVNFRTGVVLSYVPDWDLFAELAITDRGDVAVPGTTIPVLDGGFDQTALVFGLTRRFDTSKAPGPLLLLAH